MKETPWFRIPPECGNIRNVKKTTKDDNKTTLAALAHTMKSLNTHDKITDEDTSSDDDDNRISTMVYTSED